MQLFAQLRFNLQNRKACIDTSHSHRRNWASCLPGSAPGPLLPGAGNSSQTLPSNTGAFGFSYPTHTHSVPQDDLSCFASSRLGDGEGAS